MGDLILSATASGEFAIIKLVMPSDPHCGTHLLFMVGCADNDRMTTLSRHLQFCGYILTSQPIPLQFFAATCSTVCKAFAELIVSSSTSKDLHLYLNVDMSDPPPGKQSKKSRLLRPFKGLFSRRSHSPSYQGAQSLTPDNASASIPASSTNNVTSAPQVNPQGTEYTAILELSTTLSAPLTWEHRMKECGSTAYEGLKTAIQGIYDCSGIFPPLQAAAGVLLTISKVVDVRGSMCSTCKYIINLSFCPSESFSE